MAVDEPSAPPLELLAPEGAAELLQATLDAITEGILVVDGNGRIVRFNRSFVKLWGIPETLAVAGDDDALIAFVLEQLAEPAPFVRKVMELYSSPEAESVDALVFKDGRRTTWRRAAASAAVLRPNSVDVASPATRQASLRGGAWTGAPLAGAGSSAVPSPGRSRAGRQAASGRSAT